MAFPIFKKLKFIIEVVKNFSFFLTQTVSNSKKEKIKALLFSSVHLGNYILFEVSLFQIPLTRKEIKII